MAEQVEKARKAEQRTRSELVREALRAYLNKRVQVVAASKAELAAIRRGRAEIEKGEYVTLDEAWEARNDPLDPPDPIDAIRQRLDQKGRVAKDLVPHIGSRNRVYEVPQHPSSGGGVCRDRSSPGWETANPSTA